MIAPQCLVDERAALLNGRTRCRPLAAAGRKGSRRSITPGPSKWLRRSDQVPASGDRDLAAEADLLQFKQERRKIQRALNLIVTDKRMRGVLPAFGGPEVYQALAVGTHARDAPQDMKDVAWLVGAPELAFGGKCPTADQWLAGEAPQEAEVQRDIGGSMASAWKGGHPIF